MEVNSNNVCGFAMFLAELYMQLENPEVIIGIYFFKYI